MLNHKGTTTLTTERLILRRFKQEDAEDVFQNWTKDPAVTKFLSWMSHESIDTTRQMVGEWIKQYEDSNKYNWCITLGDEGKAIGHITVTQLNEKNQRCDIGYVLGSAYWGKGIMTEALQAVTEFLFNQVDMNRIQAMHDTKNPASGKVMQKVGMSYEGTMMQYRKRKDGTYGDVNIYAILKQSKKQD